MANAVLSFLAADEESERAQEGRAGCMEFARPWGCRGIFETVRTLLLWLAGDDLVLDLVIGGRRKNAASEELILGGVGAAVDDALGVGVADAVEGLELVGSGGVDIKQCCGGGGGLGCLSSGVGRHGEGRNNSDQQGDGEKPLVKSEHAWISLDGLKAFIRKGTRAERARQYAKFPRDTADCHGRWPGVRLTSLRSNATLKSR